VQARSVGGLPNGPHHAEHLGQIGMCGGSLMAEEKAKKKEKIPRQPMPEQKPQVRKRNFEEVPLGLPSELAVKEAERCLQCKKPSCMEGCPVAIDIPAFVKLIKEQEFTKAIRKIWERNALPAVCGRVCPQEIQCEGSCILAKKGDPVAIGNLERFAADLEREFGKGDLPPKAAPTGKRVAVVGSGPSGLTVAGDLILKGHDVTIFEAFHKPGGVLVYGIPEFRLPKEIVYSEVNYLERLGVKLETNVVVGRTISVEDLFEEEYDAVYIGVGAGLPRFLNIPGENLIGIYSANEYLTRANLMKAYLFPEYDTPIALGKDVVVFGAGNVAMDSARTAMRLGADRVRIVYRRSRQEMPARVDEIHHAEEEGIEFFLLTAPTRFLGDEEGRVTGVECLQMELGEPDESGRRRPVPVKGSEFQLECDLAVIAVGAGANPLLTQTTEGLELNKWGYIIADPETGKTTKKGVWAGGDIVTGQATVILAMGAGRLASDSIHSYLTWGW
jgi:glutamate synthase (NADPH/NADH) small chain